MICNMFTFWPIAAPVSLFCEWWIMITWGPQFVCCTFSGYNRHTPWLWCACIRQKEKRLLENRRLDLDICKARVKKSKQAEAKAAVRFLNIYWVEDMLLQTVSSCLVKPIHWEAGCRSRIHFCTCAADNHACILLHTSISNAPSAFCLFSICMYFIVFSFCHLVHHLSRK